MILRYNNVEMEYVSWVIYYIKVYIQKIVQKLFRNVVYNLEPFKKVALYQRKSGTQKENLGTIKN